MAGETKFLANVFSQIVSHDIVVNGDTLARAGDRIILVPVTTYRAVMVGDVSLEDLWDTLSKVGHGHADFQAALAGYQTTLATATQRLTDNEAEIARIKAWALQNGYVDSSNSQEQVNESE